MSFSTSHTTATQRVIARLYSEGWVDCPGLKFPALRHSSTPELREFILAQLAAAGGCMDKVELELAALIFSIPGHKFQVHPYLHFNLKCLKEEGFIELQHVKKPTGRGYKVECTVSLTSARPLTLGRVAV